MTNQYPQPHLMGVRHHGPGSARTVRNALTDLKPDVVLIEGPPEGQELLEWTADADLIPPVAMLIYGPKDPSLVAYYPFALFSPEWQAVKEARRLDLPARFIDLPQATQFALERRQAKQRTQREPALPDEEDGASSLAPVHQDPLAWVAAAAGYADSERWWELQVEERRDSRHLFSAISELMAALRSEVGAEEDASQDAKQSQSSVTLLREAAMRESIRGAYDEGFQKIAVVCGAWHAPALSDLNSRKDDKAVLARLPSTQVAATWVPWTYKRLAARSGYGAGIASPGWYHHLWDAQTGDSSRLAATWLTRIAHLMRAEGLVISSAHVIEAVRLAEALAALRGRPVPGLDEMMESAQSIFCFGESLPIMIVGEKLLIGDKMGSVPAEVPTVPLQADLTRLQRSLRLKPQAAVRDLDLDLRRPIGLGRSQLLHRLTLLDIPWGTLTSASSGRGTFHEEWRLEWKVELAMSVIEASVWGNRVEEAAEARARHRARTAQELAELTRLAHTLLLADLPAALSTTLARVAEMAAVAGDVRGLMAAFPPLVRVLRYGDVRGTDVEMVARVVEGLGVRICIGLPHACAGIADDEAKGVFAQLNHVHRSMSLLESELGGSKTFGAAEQLERWHSALAVIAQTAQTHALIAGRACRLLRDRKQYDSAEVARQLGVALSTASTPLKAAQWIDGFLRASGTILVYDRQLWDLIDRWVAELPADRFVETLPILRRTFATFTQPERRRLGEMAAGRDAAASGNFEAQQFDSSRAARVLPTITNLLGLQAEEMDAC